MQSLKHIYKSLGFWGSIITFLMFYICLINIYHYITTLRTFNLILIYSCFTLFLMNFSYLNENTIAEVNILKYIKSLETKFMKNFVFNTLWFLSLLIMNELFIKILEFNMATSSKIENFVSYKTSKECKSFDERFYVLDTTMTYKPLWFNIDIESQIGFNSKADCENYLTTFFAKK